MNRRRALRALVAAGVLAGVSTGCGQKGPLYLPQEKLERIEGKRKDDKTSETDRVPQQRESQPS